MRPINIEKEIENEVKKYCDKNNIFDAELINCYKNNILQSLKDKKYDFKNYKKFAFHDKNKFKKRLIFTYKKEIISNEEILLKIIKKAIENKIKFKKVNRNKIINKLFKEINLLNDNFTIIGFDFKNFYQSISNEYIYKKYLEKLNLNEDIIEILRQYIIAFPHCMQGISLSNLFAEILAQDFDKSIKDCFKKYQICFYQRFVDDGFIILNSYVDEKMCKEILKKCINKFNHDDEILTKYKNKLRLNYSKFIYISSNERKLDQFDYLGFNFKITNDNSIVCGITEIKKQKFYNKIKNIILKFNNDLPKLKTILKLYSRRIVFSYNLNGKKLWKCQGFCYNYGQIRLFGENIDDETKNFLNNIYENCYRDLNLPLPNFLSNKIVDNGYNLQNNIIKNKALVFDEKIGIGIDKLREFVKAILPNENLDNLSYNQLVKILIKKM